MTMLKRPQTRQLLIQVGIALILAIVARIAWNEWYLPSRPIAQVGAQTISQREYQALVEVDLVQRMLSIQNRINRYEEMLAAPDATKQSADGAALEQDRQDALQFRTTLVQDLTQSTSSQADSSLIEQWINQEIVLQGAARENISVSKEEIAAEVARFFTAVEEDDHHHGQDEHDADHSEDLHDTEAITDTHHSQDEHDADHSEDLHDTEAITDTHHSQDEHAEEAASVDPAQAEAMIGEGYTQLMSILKDEYGVTVGVSQAALSDYLNRIKQAELLSERVAEKLTPDDQTPQTLQVHGQYLLITPALSSSATTNSQAAAKAKVEALYQQIKDGADFVQIARQHSANPEEIVEPGWTSPDSLWPSLKEAVLNQPLGEVGPPVETPSGWYLVKILERAERRDIEMLQKIRGQRFQAWTDQQRTELEAKRF
jgi:hypothetical protein